MEYYPKIITTRCGYKLIKYSDGSLSYNGFTIKRDVTEKGFWLAFDRKHEKYVHRGYGLSQTCWMIDNMEKEREIYHLRRYLKSRGNKYYKNFEVSPKFLLNYGRD